LPRRYANFTWRSRWSGGGFATGAEIVIRRARLNLAGDLTMVRRDESGGHRFADYLRHCAPFAPTLSKSVSEHRSSWTGQVARRFGVDHACCPA